MAERNLSMQALSNLAGIPYRTLQNYLLEKRPFSIDAVVAICLALDIDANWLLLGATREANVRLGLLGEEQMIGLVPIIINAADEVIVENKDAEEVKRDAVLVMCAMIIMQLANEEIENSRSGRSSLSLTSLIRRIGDIQVRDIAALYRDPKKFSSVKFFPDAEAE